MVSVVRDADIALVLDSLRRIVRALRAGAHTVARDLGVSGAQLFVLRELAAEPGISIRRLSERTLTDPSSVSVVAARLVTRGFVTRRQDPADARKSLLSLTARGHKALASAPEPFQTHLVTALRALPPAHLKRLSAALSEVVGATGIGGGAAPMFDEEPRRTRRGD